MNTTTFQPIAPRPAPVNTEGPLAWVKTNLLADWKTSLATLLIGGVLLWLVPQILNWAIIKAVWVADYDACRVDGVGACWGVITEKYRIIIFGRYPFEEQWRPLVATLLLTGLLVALGRRSNLPAIRSFCTIYVELIRGVPLISVLFMASFMFPLFMPPGVKIDVLVRVLVGITLFAAAYSAEVIRGGLQAVPSGQVEAAATLGLSYWQTQRKIVLPQALAMVVPGIMNNFISTFKDTSLVTIVSLYELTGAMSLALNSDANWRPFTIEGYIFIALIYFVFCFSMSRYSHWVEKQVNKSKLR